jgi:hypothetical protein
MAIDPGRDWLDDMLARQSAWDPPDGFTARVAAKGVDVMPHAAPSRLGWAAAGALLARRSRDTLALAITARLEGALWVARQYWMVVQK